MGAGGPGFDRDNGIAEYDTHGFTVLAGTTRYMVVMYDFIGRAKNPSNFAVSLSSSEDVRCRGVSSGREVRAEAEAPLAGGTYQVGVLDSSISSQGNWVDRTKTAARRKKGRGGCGREEDAPALPAVWLLLGVALAAWSMAARARKATHQA